MATNTDYALQAQVHLSAAVETALNAVMAMDPYSETALAALEGKALCLKLGSLWPDLYLLPGADGIRVMTQYEGEVDTTLIASPLALAALSLSENGQDRIFKGDVRIEGDIGLGQKFQDLFARLDIDWEEQLSRLTGDIAAHQIGNWLRQGLSTGKELLDTLSRNGAEYLQYESHNLPAPVEIEEFLADVDRLRSDADRLEARLKRLERRLTPAKE